MKLWNLGDDGMEKITNTHQVRNPLTLIAVFAGLAEVAATGVLPILSGTVQQTFVWYVMLFPVLLVVAFFVTLNYNHRVLYAPSDYRDEDNFLKTLVARYSGETKEAEVLRRYWKPNGQVNKENERKLKNWLRSNGLDAESITFFLANELFSEARKRAVADLGLEGE
jgi:hypothetical protein